MKILVLNTFGFHLGYIGCYGNDWIATPNLDLLAAQGVVFDQHFVGVPDIGASSQADDWLARARRGLDDLDGGAAIVQLAGPSLAAPWVLPDDLLTLYTEDDDIEPWPNPPPGELDDEEAVLRVQDTYAAAVTWYDAQLGQLLEDITKRPWADELLLAFTASSGYPLGEHDRLGWDRPWLHEELVHVPLIIRCPGRRFAGTRIGALTQPEDFAKAVEHWEKGAAGGIEGETGLPALMSGKVETIRPHAISSWRVGTRSEHALRTADWALILPGDRDATDPPRERQLYLKPDDRWEVNDLAQQEAERADELERVLRESLPAI